jgi:hypothetical protein
MYYRGAWKFDEGDNAKPKLLTSETSGNALPEVFN